MEEKETTKKPKGIKRIIASVVIAGLLVGAGFYVVNEMQYESTDDAYVDTTTVNVSPRVSGQIEEVFVKDNQFAFGPSVASPPPFIPINQRANEGLTPVANKLLNDWIAWVAESPPCEDIKNDL